MVGSVVC